MGNEDAEPSAVMFEAEVDALAYSYVISHGYEGAIAMLTELLASHDQNTNTLNMDTAFLCRRILNAIDDEAATITRILDRMILTPHNGARQGLASLSFPGTNPIDRHIGNRLRHRRVQLGLSPTILAADLAVTPEALSAIEDGTQRLDAAGLDRASKRLSVTRTYFFQPTHDDGNPNETR